MIPAGMKLASMVEKVRYIFFFLQCLLPLLPICYILSLGQSYINLLLESGLDIGVQMNSADYGPFVQMYLVYLQYSSQCFCGNKLTYSRRMRVDDCLIPCAGDKTQACGGTWRIAVYRNPQYMQVSTSRKTMCFQTTTKTIEI